MKKQVFNPYLPSWEYVPDWEPHVFGDRVYVYGSHDQFNNCVFCPGDYVCYSAPVSDLKDWKYEGIIYKKNQDPAQDGRMVLYAPDVTQGPDGRYYLYYVFDKVGFVSVAVCGTPAGKYEFYGYVHYQDGTRLGEKSGDMPQFDPAVLTEGDKTYLYTGFCGNHMKDRHGAMATVLDKDMLTIKEEPVFIVPGDEYSKGSCFENHAFFEAPSIRKFNGLYYFVYSSEVMHELCYATSKNPTKDFVYGGVVVSNCDKGISTYKPADMPAAYGANNHGGIEFINGDYYIFYHRHTNGNVFSRQGCSEKLSFTSDGRIPQVQMTSCGLNGGKLKGEGYYPSYIACNLFCDSESVYTGGAIGGGNFMGSEFPRIMQDGKDGDEEIGYIANMTSSSTAGFKFFDLKGSYISSVRIRSYGGGVIEVRSKWDGEILGTAPVENYNIWTDVSVDIPLPDDADSLFFTCRGWGCPDFAGFELKKR